MIVLSIQRDQRLRHLRRTGCSSQITRLSHDSHMHKHIFCRAHNIEKRGKLCEKEHAGSVLLEGDAEGWKIRLGATR